MNTKIIPAILSEATTIVIKDTASLSKAVEVLSRLNHTLDQIEQEKAKVLRPLLYATAAERARWKPFEDQLKPQIATLRSTITKYQTEARRIEEEAKAKIAARIGEGKGKLKLETALNKIESLEGHENSITSDSGSVKFRTTQNFEVMDLTMVPVEYLLPNEPAIRKAMKEGIKLPGVRYFSEEIVVNSR